MFYFFLNPKKKQKSQGLKTKLRNTEKKFY